MPLVKLHSPDFHGANRLASNSVIGRCGHGDELLLFYKVALIFARPLKCHRTIYDWDSSKRFRFATPPAKSMSIGGVCVVNEFVCGHYSH